MTEPLPTGFPDLFAYTLRDQLSLAMLGNGEYDARNFVMRPIRVTDETRTIGIVEGEAEPAQYEIANNVEPSLLDWTVVIQALVKHSNEIEGRNVRRHLLQGVRKTLFLPGTVQALMTLNDGYDRVSRFRLRRLDFSSVEARDSNKQFFFLGQAEVSFQTEKL
jgi:hypothetical protein